MGTNRTHLIPRPSIYTIAQAGISFLCALVMDHQFVNLLGRNRTMGLSTRCQFVAWLEPPGLDLASWIADYRLFGCDISPARLA